MAYVIEGTAAFSSLTKHDVYMGASTGKFNITVTLDQDSADKLAEQGVKLKDYEDKRQRKFATKYDVVVVDADNQPFLGEVPPGSTVRVKYKVGKPHPVHGTTVYLEAVRVLELAEGAQTDDEF